MSWCEQRRLWSDCMDAQADLSLLCAHMSNGTFSYIPARRPWWLSWMRRPTGPGGRGFNPRRGRQHSFVEIDHEIFSMVILSLPLIQEGQLSVSGERMCTILVNRLEDWACPVNVWLGKLTALDMTPLGWLGRKTSTQTNKQTFRLTYYNNVTTLSDDNAKRSQL